MILRELADAPRLRRCAATEASRSHRVSGIEDAGPGDLTFVANPRYAPRLATTRASAVIVSPDLQTPAAEPRLARNPYLAFARAVGAPPSRRPGPRRASIPPAQVDPTAASAPDVHVGPLAVVGARVRGSARARVLHPHVVLYAGRRDRRGLRPPLRRARARGLPPRPPRRGAERRRHRRRRLRLRAATRTAATRRSRRSGSWWWRTTSRSAPSWPSTARPWARRASAAGTKIDNLVQIGHSVTIGARHRPGRPGGHRRQHAASATA